MHAIASVKKLTHLRPSMKAILSMTPAAVEQVKNLLANNGEGAQALKIGVSKRGCNGLSYTMKLASKKEKFDEEVNQDGARLFVESKALLSVIGSEMDFQSNQLSSGFVFSNPNIKHTCACGESFTTSNS